MYCPTCGSEERQISQYCRACGTDLRVVRRGLERPDSITASAVSAREQISQVMAEKIRQMESAHDLIPFITVGVVTFLIGLGIVLNGLAFTLPRKKIDDRSDEAQSQRELES